MLQDISIELCLGRTVLDGVFDTRTWANTLEDSYHRPFAAEFSGTEAAPTTSVAFAYVFSAQFFGGGACEASVFKLLKPGYPYSLVDINKHTLNAVNANPYC